MASGEYSSVLISNLIWALRWAWLWFIAHLGLLSFFDPYSVDETSSQPPPPPPSTPLPSPSPKEIRESLHLARYCEIEGRLPAGGGSTCAVCLCELGRRDHVWELRNCCHVFHKRCLDRWLEHDEHKRCPLCRAPLMGPDLGLGSSGPSWAVEQLLYLFGDDLMAQ